MQARVAFENDVVIIHLIGRLGIETASSFRTTCTERLGGKKVVFNFRELGFVGSTGILPFLEALEDLAKDTSTAVKFSQVGCEFRKVFESTSLKNIEVFDSDHIAVRALLKASTIQGASSAPDSSTSIN